MENSIFLPPSLKLKSENVLEDNLLKNFNLQKSYSEIQTKELSPTLKSHIDHLPGEIDTAAFSKETFGLRKLVELSQNESLVSNYFPLSDIQLRAAFTLQPGSLVRGDQKHKKRKHKEEKEKKHKKKKKEKKERNSKKEKKERKKEAVVVQQQQQITQM